MAADPREATESLADYLRRRAVDIERYSSGETRAVFRALRDIEREIRVRLERYDPTGVRLSVARQRRLERLLEDTNERIAALMRKARDQFGGALQDFAEVEAAAMIGQMQTTFALTGIPDPVKLVPRNILEALAGQSMIEGAPIKDWWGRQSAQLRQRFTDQMRLGVAQGETVGQLVQRVRGTRAGGFLDGIMGTTTRQAEALVRSSVNAVGNDARLAVFQANADVIEALAHISTLDSRTTLQCAGRDGKTWTLDRKPINHTLPFQSPPIHWNCRSILAPKVFGADRLPGSLRASESGPVPAARTFDDWLKGKSRADQDAILGPNRARLWRENKLTLRQLLDFRGDPLTLDQLRSRYSFSGEPKS